MKVVPHSIPDVEGFVTSLVRNVPGAVYRCDVDAGFTMQLIGDEVERISGYPAADFIGSVVRSFDSIIHPDDRARVHEEVGVALETDDPYVLEYRIVTAAGAARWVLDRGLRAVDAFGRECLDGIIFDVTHRRLAEEARLRSEAAAARAVELEASRARIVAAADDARRRIERDLHDGAQQRLVAASLALRVAERRLAENPDGAAMMLVRARTELEAGLEELRELARGIHPAVLTDHGLADALRALAERAALPVRIECRAPTRLDPRIETALYYCATEAITNIVKHAGATHARVGLRIADGIAELEVSDNGCGGARLGGGSGLSGLEDRLAVVGGALEVDSVRGRGTVLRATIPAG